MALITKPYTLSNGAKIYAAEHNSNYDTIYNDYNGNITNANVASNASIVGTKLDLTSVGAVGSTSPSTGKFTTLEVTTDIYTTAWTAYGATSTIVGWSAYTSKLIYYKKVGKLVFVQFDLGGTSDSGAVTFTLPISNNSTVGMWAKLGFAYDNSIYAAVTGSQNAIIYMAAASTSVVCARYLAATFGNWTAANNKQVIGEFFYHID